MSIKILTADPYNNQQYVAIDSKIVIEFDSEIDPFTIENGVSLYTPSPSMWTGPDLAILNNKHMDGMDMTEEYTYFQFNWTLEDTDSGVINGKLTLTPLVTLLPDRDYFVAIYPGLDSSRYLSKITTSAPVTVLDDASTGLVEIASAYKGIKAGTLSIVVTGINGLEIEFTATDLENNSTVHNVDFAGGIKLTLPALGSDDIPVTWALLDSIEIDVFAGEGVDSLFKNQFTTTHIALSDTPSSTKINTLSDIGRDVTALKLLGSIPDNLAIDNIRYNPVTLKFNQDINLDQDISSKIKIKRKDIDSGVVRTVNYYYKITGSTIKLYLTSLA